MAAAIRTSILLTLLGGATPLLACSVCGYAAPESRAAFILTTALLSFAPLLFIGVVVWYLKNKTSEHDIFTTQD